MHIDLVPFGCDPGSCTHTEQHPGTTFVSNMKAGGETGKGIAYLELRGTRERGGKRGVREGGEGRREE